MSDEIPFVRKEFSDLIARRIYPAMKRLGLRRQGKRLWYEQRPDSSWVLMEIQVSHHTTRTKLEFTVNTAVWPPGTWAERQRSHPVYAAEPVPFVALGAPICARPQQVRPDLWPAMDFVEVTLSGDLDRAMADLQLYLQAALEWGRALADVESALDFLTRPFDMQTHRHAPNYATAIVMLRAVQPDHPRLPQLLDTMTEQWRMDPRPITFRDELQRWRAEAGLAPAEGLPTYWHVAMLPANIKEWGWPESAYRLTGSEFYFADGTRSRTPPPGWPRRP